MDNVDFAAVNELVAARQSHLRSLARPGDADVAVAGARRGIGRLMVRLGRWVEGARHEPVVEAPVRVHPA